MRLGQAGHRAQRAEERRAEPAAGNDRGQHEQRQRRGRDRDDEQDRAHRQGRGADPRHPRRRQVGRQHGRDRAGRREHAEDRPDRRVVRLPEHGLEQRTADREHQPAEGPGGEHRRSRAEEGAAGGGRDGDLRLQRGDGAGDAAHGLGQHQGGEREEHEQGGEDDEDQPGGVRCPLDQDAGDDGPDTEPGRGRRAVDQRPEARPVGRLQVEQVRAEHPDTGTGGQALHDPRHDQPAHTVGAEEHRHRGGVEHERGGQHGAAADEVREPPDGQQAEQQGQHVDGEDGRQRDGREPELGLVDGVERAGGARGGQHRRRRHGHQPERGAARQPPAGRGDGRHGLR